MDKTKETAYNPKAEKGAAVPDSNTATPDAVQTEIRGEGSGVNKITVTLRHKTEYPAYRRAGLVLKQTPEEFEVTAEQLAVLKKDAWVEVVKK